MKKIASLFILICFGFSLSFSTYAETITPKISVIIPVYNAEKYIAECLDSLVNQTLMDLEIICVNDGSRDNSLRILRQYELKDSRIKVIDQKNQGACVARNAGINIATGKYIAFVDADDYLNLNAYKIAYSEAKNKDLDILCFGWQSFPVESNWDKAKSSPKQKYFENDSINAWFYCGTGANVNIWNKLYKRSFLVEGGVLFKRNLKCAQDYYFNMLLFPKAKKIEFIPDRLYNYRRDVIGSISSQNKDAFRMKSHMEVIKEVLKDWNQNGYSKGFEAQLVRLFVNWNMYTMMNIPDKAQRAETLRDFLQEIEPIYYGKPIFKDSLNKIKKIKNIINGEAENE